MLEGAWGVLGSGSGISHRPGRSGPGFPPQRDDVLRFPGAKEKPPTGGTGWAGVRATDLTCGMV